MLLFHPPTKQSYKTQLFFLRPQSKAPQKNLTMASTIPTRTLYQVLGILPDATQAQIRSHFLKKSLEMHPDKAGSTPQANEAYAIFKNAYEVLRNPTERAEYDANLRNPAPPPAPHQPTPSPAPPFFHNTRPHRDPKWPPKHPAPPPPPPPDHPGRICPLHYALLPNFNDALHLPHNREFLHHDKHDKSHPGPGGVFDKEYCLCTPCCEGYISTLYSVLQIATRLSTLIAYVRYWPHWDAIRRFLQPLRDDKEVNGCEWCGTAGTGGYEVDDDADDEASSDSESESGGEEEEEEWTEPEPECNCFDLPSARQRVEAFHNQIEEIRAAIDRTVGTQGARQEAFCPECHSRVRSGDPFRGRTLSHGDFEMVMRRGGEMQGRMGAWEALEGLVRGVVEGETGEWSLGRKGRWWARFGRRLAGIMVDPEEDEDSEEDEDEEEEEEEDIADGIE